VRAIRHAEPSISSAATWPRSSSRRPGRPSKALTVDQARALVKAAAGDLPREGEGRKRARPCRLHAYAVLLLLTTGIRPEEARALRWITSTWTPGRWPSGVLTAPGATRSAEVAADPEAPADRRGRAQGTQDRPGRRPAQVGRALAGQRPCFTTGPGR
jgi:integrase